MAGGTIWKGIIHFGDTDVPVKLHTAVREERIQFHLLHEPDQVRVRQQLICALEKRPVPAEEQSKGFEMERGNTSSSIPRNSSKQSLKATGRSRSTNL